MNALALNNLRRQTSSPLVWAIFLGVSWTWCIGMFLPVLLIRDYGRWAWVVFAVPNCIGAAAMGWVMRSADDSAAFVRRHRLACEAFSLVTIAFQIFFATWMLPRLVGPAGYITVAVLVQAAFTPLRNTRTMLGLAAAVLAISLLCAAGLTARGTLQMPAGISVAPLDLLGIALVCAMGFIFSPYLDLTFHQARQATTPRGGRVAFAVGFCVVFASMIVLSFFYADTFVRMRGISAVLLSIHLSVQMAFTVDAHAAALRGSSNSDVTESTEAAPKDDLLGRPALALAVSFGFAVGLAGLIDASHRGLTVGELSYRTFLSFYGLFVPAYLLTSRARRPRLMCLATIVLATPVMWMAFIERQMAWAIAAAAVLGAAAIIVQLQPRAISKRQ